ncbi:MULTISPECIES: GNAT family protein [Ponticaulis]|uniref:GNAT family N-acetyltransferase n=1 Tax=Ponticaulis TaxID=1123044 RepID=UPI0003B6D3F5|nr:MULTISPECIES: GNAT family protein [Ponticaulis]MAJ09932.1 N-acetyltransferase [Ponticaulis sp.]RPG18542.1 MAG: N-acetyltransferase [Hyphomonadaceae bacterium TMED125]HBH90098.1 N-acetyltransferase [Hyphomonadaceae bacterium]HBJ93926.1 N-acetyltransferase [Hyphomonadaceae bacterium]|tara:strand:- start:25861 stop:26388 length:528 start_codon:yes stop_codon:yes gene_type:complete
MLTGEITGLRAIEESDLEQLLAWRNDPRMRRFFREYRELNMTQQKSWFDAKVNNDPATRMFAIVDLETKELMGAAGLCYIDGINRNADFSIYLGIDDLYIDEDYAPDAGRVLLRYGFEELNLHKVWAEIYSIDKPKQQLFYELGFTREGVHRETHWTEGQWVDSLFYGLLAKDFR